MTDRTKELLRIWISRSSICSNVNEAKDYCHTDLTEILSRLSEEEFTYEELLSELDNVEPSLCEQHEGLDKLAKIIYMLMTYCLDKR